MARVPANFESGDPAFVTDAEGRIVAWNESAERLLGYSAADVVGRACSEIIDGRDVFGNLYCRGDCNPCRMIQAGLPIRRFELDVRKVSGGRARVTVSTLSTSVGDPPKRVLVHLLFPTSGASNSQEAPISGELALLVSDIEGSTELFERLGEDGARRVVRVHNRILRRCLRAYLGDEIQHTGDGMIAAFTSPSRAVRCSVLVQQECARHNRLSSQEQVPIRIGLHAGAVRREEFRLFGSAVNVTVRVCSQAQAGQIVITAELARRFDASSFRLIDGGQVRLKGLSQAFRLFEVDWRQLDVQAEPGEERT